MLQSSTFNFWKSSRRVSSEVSSGTEKDPSHIWLLPSYLADLQAFSLSKSYSSQWLRRDKILPYWNSWFILRITLLINGKRYYFTERHLMYIREHLLTEVISLILDILFIVSQLESALQNMPQFAQAALITQTKTAENPPGVSLDCRDIGCQ